MIEYTMLILLGICIGGLVAFLFAPSVWHRAVRLTTRRLEATMPMSLSEIEADKDLLRASYAVKIRRLEAGLNSARDKSANQLVEISRHQMEIAELRRQTAKLNSELEERRNAAAVFETTIRKRLPELEQLVASANSALDERAADLEDLQRKLERREEMLQQVQRSATQQQEELARLRAVLERQGEDRTGRFKRRPMEWGLDEYRSEYDRLNLEMSRMREQLARSSELETQRISVLKREMQQLAEQIIATASTRDAAGRDWREHEAQTHQEERPRPILQRQPQPPRGQRQAPLVTSRPWPGGTQNEPAPAAVPRPLKTETQTEAPRAEAKPDADAAKTARPNLSSLLASAVRNDADADKTPIPDVETSAASEEAAAASAVKASAETDGAATAASSAASVEQAAGQPKLDQVFREILDGPSSAAAAEKTAETASAAAEKPAPQSSQDTEDKPAESSTKTQTLVDRLRLVQERQTG
jgi:hypothetical protein